MEVLDLGVRVSDLIGQRYGRLTVVEYAGLTDDFKAKWLCRCDCGNEKIVRAASLKSGGTRSCGCLYSEARKKCGAKMRGENSPKYKHGLSQSRINGIYRDIKGRCKNPNNPAYSEYGGRGIKICDEWDADFMAFYNWSMAHGYTDSLTIDRIDNNKGYSPDNCRWVNHQVQQNNRRNNVRIAYNGEEHTLSEWAKIVGISKKAIYHRYERKWSVSRMLNYPVLYEPVEVADELSDGERGSAGFGSSGR